MFEEAKTFPKPTKWESSSFAYNATQPNEKKTFKQVMAATAFQVKKESIDERMTKEKHFHRVFHANAFWLDDMRLLKSQLSNIR